MARRRRPFIGRLATAAMLASGCIFVQNTDDTDGGSSESGEPSDTSSGPGDTSSGPGSSSTAMADGSTDGGIDQAPVCAQWLACLERSDPDAAADQQTTYGEQGTCWFSGPTAAQTCTAACSDNLADCESGTTTGGIEYDCSLDNVAPGVRSPVEVGEDEGMLPAEIGLIVELYCGCHLVDDNADLVPLTPEYNGEIRLRTWDDFHAGFEGQPTWRHVQERSIEEQNMPPVYHCGTYDFGSIHAMDYELLSAWLDAAAPDAPTWAAR